jgi:hypothetical protein
MAGDPMLTRTRTRARRTRHKNNLQTPTIQSLLSHIIRATFTSGMLFLYVAGTTLIMLLDYNRIPLDIPIILVFGPLILLVFVNGSSAWQQDWHAFHRKLADRQNRDMERLYSHNH